MSEHPYIRYAQALVMHTYNLNSISDIKFEFLIAEIEKGIAAFSMQPSEMYEGKEKVKFCYIKKKNSASDFIFLSPNAIISEIRSKDLWNAANDYINHYKACEENNLTDRVDIKMSQIPISGELLIFSAKGGASKGCPKSTVFEQGLGLVTTLTKNKPCLQYICGTDKNLSIENSCIIPDLSIQDMVDFIYVFERMNEQELSGDLMYGKVKRVEKKKNISFEPKRPQICRGNFPNAPMSSALGSIALLGAIGEFAKKTNSSLAMKVLDQLKDVPIYLIKYGNASIFSYHHYIVDLAKAGCLRTIVDSMYHIWIYKEGKRERGNLEYQKLDLFASRFLQSFTRPAFRDFMSIRAEYPSDLFVLLKTYFEKMEKIDSCVVASAKSLGQWLNLLAYKVSKVEGTYSKDELNALKSKVLIEFESAIFSAKSGDALIAQVMVRAGRLFNSDAPADAVRYMEETASGNLPLDKAKNLLVAFMRLNTYKEKSKLLIQEDSSLEGGSSNENIGITSSDDCEINEFLEDE